MIEPGGRSMQHPMKSPPTERKEPQLPHPEPPKRRGRPRVMTSDIDPLQKRRDQVRQAQNRYRSKQDSTILELQNRIDQLKQDLRRQSEVFSTFYAAARKSNLSKSEPELLSSLNEAAVQFTFEGSADSSILIAQDAVENPSDFTSNSQLQNEIIVTIDSSPVSNATFDCHSEAHVYQENDNVPQNSLWPSGGCSKMLPSPFQELELGKTYHSLSFHESSISRQVHRYCLEYAFQLFTDPTTNPQVFYRVFRLVPCIADRSKMQPYFKNLLSKGAGESLEISRLPFYMIGGAGRHYTRKDGSGRAIFPANTRLPKRILGFNRLSGTDHSENEKAYTKFLEMRGYDGIWFNSYEVERYLRQKVVSLDTSYAGYGIRSNVPYPAPTPPPDQLSDYTTISYASPSGTTAQSQTHKEDSIGYGHDEPNWSPGTAQLEEDNNECDGFISSRTSSFFDVQRFLDHLTLHVVILGRAPGFKKSAVDAAIDYALCLNSAQQTS